MTYVKLMYDNHELPAGYVSRAERYPYDSKWTLLDTMATDENGYGTGYNEYMSNCEMISEDEYHHLRVMNPLTNDQKKVRRNIQAKRRREAKKLEAKGA